MSICKLPDNLVKAEFISRLNRFVALVRMGDRDVKVHVPSSGRMRELLVPGARVYLSPSEALQRKTAYTLLLVRQGEVLVSVDSLLPNRLLYTSFLRGEVPGFTGFTRVRREFPYRRGRMDFLLSGGGKECLVEVKSVTLVEKGLALFPDAPTGRGARHLEELTLAYREGYRVAVIFVVQREDGDSFSPNDRCDPHFGETLRQAARNGVEVYALGCRVTTDKIQLHGSLPVLV
ncbi:DNA/RNA nuclease SfsA [Desulfolucanica intricata]|uniref:DNA/RNA nuclease SfsA n=1 Tax=Desulfolucanica intricata TaxID=1285191 RepID=UPI000830DF4B|nr:DNA/RNA nuclease SfsA [Desulfolucanica intricata]